MAAVLAEEESGSTVVEAVAERSTNSARLSTYSAQPVTYARARVASDVRGRRAPINQWRELEEQLPSICQALFDTLGSRNLEGSYQRALAHELRTRGVQVQSELPISIMYDGIEIGSRRLHLLLQLQDGAKAIIELKAVKTVSNDHLKQLEYYIYHFAVDKGFLINFPHEAAFPDLPSEAVFTTKVLHGAPPPLSDRTLKSRVQDQVEVIMASRVPVVSSATAATSSVESVTLRTYRVVRSGGTRSRTQAAAVATTVN